MDWNWNFGTNVPKIFALANNKNGRIAEYGRWEENVWRWDISLRRNLFDWEVTQWDRLETLLIDVQISKTLKDDMVWKGEANGLYTSKYFCKKLMEPTDMRDKIWKNIWASLAPHRIEVFVWQLLHGKVGVKEELVSRGLIQDNQSTCALCNKESEFVNHLFIFCSETWKVWVRWCELFGYQWSVPGNVKLFFDSWNNCYPGKADERICRMSYFTVVWTIWKCRNDVVFNGKDWDSTQCWEISKIRVASWANEYPSILTTFMFPEVGCGGEKKIKERKSATWEKPKLGQLKFNVDGAAQGCPGPAGIGGILRNEKGEALITFSKLIGIANSTTAEVLAVKEAFLIFSASRWKDNHSLLIESDACNIVKWIKDLASAPWRLRFWMNQIERFKKLCTEWEIRHSLREANQEADSLAKAAIHLQSEILRRY